MIDPDFQITGVKTLATVLDTLYQVYASEGNVLVEIELRIASPKLD